MKRLSELTPEEVKALLSVNKWLKKTAEERAQENAGFLVEEILEPFRTMSGIDYNVGYPADYFDVGYTAYKDFLYTCIDHDYKELVFGDFFPQIERAADRAQFFENCLFDYEDISAKNYDRLETWIASIVEKAARSIVCACNLEFEWAYTDEAIEEAAAAFCEFNGEVLETDGKIFAETTCRKYA